VRIALDTNICIALINGKPSSARERLAGYPAGDVVMSVIVLYELLQGAMKSGRPEANLANVRDFKLFVPAIEFNENDAAEASKVRRQLESSGRPIGPYDMLIAGHARSRGLILATNNRREFERVPDLRVEDWLQEG